ncbi:hypothetical protein CLV46_1514 [Diaminobutyricimonas aerilata]|uniref:Uncharacterized protein n=1 Tax=Diaminobutyricimonas aerilata TaxID=1162967 RepID=A0A2M9CJA8_9MICO|nr:hypothetical protein [Diaminobutyricimonas aerilata]PJJ71955.1 hypothetical protein CLV46_1514 [Diaminobutyricimonas aerilata]
MQIGTRWAVGGEPPARLPEAVVEAVRGVEAELADADTSRWRWTLTWLENRPVVELDDGTVIRVGRDGTVTVAHDEL